MLLKFMTKAISSWCSFFICLNFPFKKVSPPSVGYTGNLEEGSLANLSVMLLAECPQLFSLSLQIADSDGNWEIVFFRWEETDYGASLER